ncbi:MAG: hypothetical protein M1609_02390 [Firmicutes bacterium]|nr:hypothetical protein [Bacillota bacterium]
MNRRKELRQAERRHREKLNEHRKATAAHLGMRLARIEKLCERGGVNALQKLWTGGCDRKT